MTNAQAGYIVLTGLVRAILIIILGHLVDPETPMIAVAIICGVVTGLWVWLDVSVIHNGDETWI